tara:strand:- start:241 stop:516 length:276 start_codon:yes stop_codon:yes gene_type:complete
MMENEYDNSGRAVAWKPKKAGMPLSIKVTAHRDLQHGEEFEVAIWRARDKKSEKHPDFTGQCQDKWKPAPPRANTNSSVSRDQDFDDDIPF